MIEKNIIIDVLTEHELENIVGGYCDGNRVCWLYPDLINHSIKPYCENYLPAYPGKLFPQC